MPPRLQRAAFATVMRERVRRATLGAGHVAQSLTPACDRQKRANGLCMDAVSPQSRSEVPEG